MSLPPPPDFNAQKIFSSSKEEKDKVISFEEATALLATNSGEFLFGRSFIATKLKKVDAIAFTYVLHNLLDYIKILGCMNSIPPVKCDLEYKTLEEQYGNDGQQVYLFDEAVEPNEAENKNQTYLKFQRDRDFLETLLVEAEKEISSKQTTTNFLRILEEYYKSESERNQLLEDTKTNLNMIKTLSETLQKEKQRLTNELHEKSKELGVIKDQYEDLVYESGIKFNFVDHWENARGYQNNKILRSKEENSLNALKTYDNNNLKETRINSEIEAFEIYLQSTYSEEIENWMNKYTKDMESKEMEKQMLKEQREEQLKELHDLQSLFDLRKREIEEYCVLREQRCAEADKQKELNKAATKIQAWWRGMMYRKGLGPYKKKKKGKKNDAKGKKNDAKGKKNDVKGKKNSGKGNAKGKKVPKFSSGSRPSKQQYVYNEHSSTKQTKDEERLSQLQVLGYTSILENTVQQIQILGTIDGRQSGSIDIDNKTINEKYGSSEYQSNHFDTALTEFKFHKDLRHIEKILTKLCQELITSNEITNFLERLHEYEDSENQAQELLQEAKLNKEKVKMLQHSLETSKSTTRRELHEKSQEIKKIAAEYEDMVYENNIREDYIGVWENSRMYQTNFLISRKEDKLQEAINSTLADTRDETKVNWEIEYYENTLQNEYTELIETWMTNYDNDLENNDMAIQTFIQKRTDQLETLNNLQDEYNKRENEMNDYIKARGIRLEKEEKLRKMNEAAIKIQMWWRKLLYKLHLGPYRKGKNKKKN